MVIVGVGTFGSVENPFLKNIYLENLKYNQINISQLCDIKYTIKFGKHECVIINLENEIIAKGRREHANNA